MTLSEQWIAVPVLLPLLAGAALLVIPEQRHQLKFNINLLALLGQMLLAALLLWQADQGGWPAGMAVFYAADWQAPFGIVLLADRLSALMLLLIALIATAALVYSHARWARLGVHFHSLLQFLVMGMSGSVLTADLFNLFVFFEVMLAASYGLLLHGYNLQRVKAGMQYIAINLVASVFFLIGVALIYTAVGTLTYSDIADNVAALGAQDRLLFLTGVGVMAVAFLTKAAIWPLGFWLPGTYAAAAPPVTALLVLLTKVGVYILLRLYLLLFSEAAGISVGFGGSVLFWGGVLTMAYGAAGLLASQEAGRMASYSAVISSGTLLAIVGYGQPELIAPGLFYLLSSTLAVAAFALLIELNERIYKSQGSLAELALEARAADDKGPESAGRLVPGAQAFLGLAFVGCALVMAGLPPMSGFVAKFGIVHTMLNGENQTLVSIGSLCFTAMLFLAGLSAIVSMMRLGVRTFWISQLSQPPQLRLTEAAPVTVLLFFCLLLVLFAQPVTAYLGRISTDLQQPAHYIRQVMQIDATTGGQR